MKIGVWVPEKYLHSVRIYYEQVSRILSQKGVEFIPFGPNDVLPKNVDLYWDPTCTGGKNPNKRFQLREHPLVATVHGASNFALPHHYTYKGWKNQLKGYFINAKRTFYWKYFRKNIEGIIASDMDYDIPLQGNPKYLRMIPNPVNIEKLPYIPLTIEDKIVIFHGINTQSYFKKGNDYFEEALKIVAQQYGHQVEIITTRNIPYQEYIEIYNRAHILLDMAYSFDQGYHALEAMAKGKVVFTGAETEFYDFYQLHEKVNINAKPDVDYLVNQLSFLIDNPDEILTISRNARAFIEKEHNYIRSAEKYLQTWKK